MAKSRIYRSLVGSRSYALERSEAFAILTSPAGKSVREVKRARGARFVHFTSGACVCLATGPALARIARAGGLS